jgi:phage-related protein
MEEKQLSGKRQEKKLPENNVRRIEKKSRRDASKKSKKKLQNDAKREHRVTFMLNEKEHNAIERFLRKYKIKNKSHWYRTTILTHIWKVMMDDYPTLFNENEMR